ncbi:hypothetical protein DBZ36_00485 [Alginatibacterium sediminis]|uniref:Nucleotide-diphospho-sugar transferase domain-containing protein n=1 Tax=Alginatibacterium sediminis TaxID=2164068 RepID=A0A420EN62_9ALTE|nr:hypothetical protein [Alginatibacterium sediminis]RKF22157.1 hypothetical protein DBZ36_00485 [Alginatibacterium sediminis]
MKNYLVYILYGSDDAYYLGAKFSILSFISRYQSDTELEVIVLAEYPEKFEGFDISVLKLTDDQLAQWSLQGSYHFRIKNRGLHFIAQHLELRAVDKILFLDTDTYFTKNPSAIFDLINAEHSVMHQPGNYIEKEPAGSEYSKLWGFSKIMGDGSTYKLNPFSRNWGALMIGLQGSNVDTLDVADELMLAFMERDCRAHTIEQFALAEAIVRQQKLVEGRALVEHYSTSGRKDYAISVLKIFFATRYNSFQEMLIASRAIRFQRPLRVVIAGHFYKKSKKLRAMLGLKIND